MKANIWKAWAPGKIKIFSWLLHWDRLWCNDRLQRRGWPNSYFCQLCLRHLESSTHLFRNCTFSRAIWNEVATWRSYTSLLVPQEDQASTPLVIKNMLSTAERGERRGAKTMIMATTWAIWCERNNYTFRGKLANSTEVIEAIGRIMEQWRLAGAKAIEPPFGDRDVR